MSTRALRIYLEEQEQQKQRIAAVQDLDSPQPASSTIRKNIFDVLGDGDDVDSELEYEEPESGVNYNTSIHKEETPFLKDSDDVVPSQKQNAKKKKKKAKESSGQIARQEKQNLDIILKNFALDFKTLEGRHRAPSNKNVSMANAKSIPNNQTGSSLLKTDPKWLKPENELRRFFGSKVVRSYENSIQAESSGHIRKGRRRRHFIRKTTLATPSEDWPPWDKSLSMEFLKTKGRVHYFRYMHSLEYKKAQYAYEEAKKHHDLSDVCNILVNYPYHLDSLVAISDYFKLIGEYQLAAEAISRCLYALERSWHPLFTPLQGNCRLEFIHKKNRPFFRIMFIHIKNTGRRGCHRVALELCKLLFSLDSNDPMGIKFCIDYYAIRAEQYAWLHQLTNKYEHETGKSPWHFPNFACSISICSLYNKKKRKESTVLMKMALRFHPTLLKKLVAKVPLKDRIWNTILENSFFNRDFSGSLTLDHLTDIYVERSYILWRLPDLQNFLKDAALMVIEVVEKIPNDAWYWARLCSSSFSYAKNEYKHLLVSDFSDEVFHTIPHEELHNIMVGVDPVMLPHAGHLRQGDPMELHRGRRGMLRWSRWWAQGGRR